MQENLNNFVNILFNDDFFLSRGWRASHLKLREGRASHLKLREVRCSHTVPVARLMLLTPSS